MIFEVIKVGIDLFTRINELRWTPTGLEGDLLLFFQDFKKAIDTKDVKRLERLVSDKYYSYSFTNTNKRELLAYFEKIFNLMPFFVRPSLEIQICKMPEIREQEIHIVIRPTLNAQTLGITFFSTPFGTENPIALALVRDTYSGLFSVLNMESV